MKDYTSIGYTKKLYGVKGGIRVQIKEEYFDSFAESKVLFLKIDGRKIPFFIQNIIDSPPLRVLFEDHTDRTTAQALTGKEIFLPSDQIIQPDSPSTDLTTLEGFSMEDSIRGSIGKIRELQEYPQQIMAIVEVEDKEILIPLHEHLIDRIEMDSQTIFVSLPDGILEL